MKKLLYVLYSTLFTLTFTISPLWGQGGSDSIRISYSEETGPLEKQRFIDQYDYVFMTKEPTKWMARIASSSSYTYGGLVGSYEYKLSPSWSLGIGGYIPSSSLNRRDAGIFGEFRYYYDMRKRIREGKSANNFSGSYWALSFTKAFDLLSENYYTTTYNLSQAIPTLGMNSALEFRWGMQHRFFNNGLIDFGVAMGVKKRNEIGTLFFPQTELSLQTYYSTALAFGDFKRKQLPPVCDVLKCYETNKSLWKIAWPSLLIGTINQSLSTSVAYEHQLGKSPFSINLQNNLQLNRWFFADFTRTKTDSSHQVIGREKGDIIEKQLFSTTYVQPRFYFGHSRYSKKTTSKTCLVGWYLGISLVHIYDGVNSKFGSERKVFDRYHGIEIGPTFGFQQKVFKNGYIDFNFTVGKTILRFDDNGSVKETYGFRPNFKIGFAF